MARTLNGNLQGKAARTELNDRIDMAADTILTDAERQAIRDNVFATQTANMIVWEYRNSVDVDAFLELVNVCNTDAQHQSGEMSDIDRWGENEALYRDLIGGN
jgi:NADH:ubiquinone oxidoreductase subunit B-like Fe-S oxidoreductase